MLKLKLLRGRKVLLNLPVIDKSPIVISPEVQEQMDRELVKKYCALEVYAVGSEASPDILPGMKVYIPGNSLTNAERIEVDGEMKMMVSDFDVTIIWE